MKMRKFFITALALCLMLVLLPMGASAAEVASGTCGENVTWTLTDDGILTISGEGEMEDYTSNDTKAPWYYSYSDYGVMVTSAVVEEGVTSIGDYAFNSTQEMVKVTLPESVEEIGASAFAECSRLTTINIPKAVTRIGSGAFYWTNLTDVVIPEGVTIIEADTFNACDELISVQLPESLTAIEENGFAGCHALTEITIPKAVKSIGAYAFIDCGSLSKIVFKGDAPTIADDTVFMYVTATAYYPADNATWTSEVMQNYGGTLTWVAGNALNAPVVKGSNVESTGKIKLTWDKVDGAAKYQVYRATSKSGTYKPMKTTTNTYYINTSAVAGKSYYYYVVAVSADGTESQKSNIVSRTCDCARPVVTGSNVASSGKIKLTWDAVDGAEKYEIHRSTSKNGTYTLMYTTSKTSYTNTSATAGKTYYYKVKAIGSKEAANSAYSTVVSRTCDLPRPEVTIALRSSDSKPRLKWDAVDGAVEYEVYRATSKSGEFTLIRTVTSTSFTDTSAKSGTTYYYKVGAVASKSAANSAYSSVVSIKSK